MFEEIIDLINVSDEILAAEAVRLSSSVKGNLQRRIFNDGKDNKGVSLGGYSSSWADVREKAGASTTKKNYDFTGTLRKSIDNVVIDGGAQVVVKENSYGGSPLNSRAAYPTTPKITTDVLSEYLDDRKPTFEASELDYKKPLEVASNNIEKEFSKRLRKQGD